MPWKTSDVDKFKKGLTDKQKDKWVAVANAALKECTDKGGDRLECEASAIRIANAKFSDDKTIRSTTYMHEVAEEGDLRMETRLRLGTQPAQVSDDYQMVLPVGVFYSDWYGEIIITNSYAEAMVDNWKNKVMGNREPFVDTLHDRGKANGWIEDLEARDDGLYAKIRWTRQGKEYLEEEYFKFFSADLGQITHVETGKTAWPVLFAVALCNTPVMNTMPQAHLAELNQVISSAHSDGSKNIPHREGNTMNLAEVLEYLKDAKDSEKTVVLTELGAAGAKEQVMKLTADVERLTGEKETLAKANTDLAEEVKALRATAHKTRKAEVINKALSEGRILPKDKEDWEKRFDQNAEFTAEVLEKLPPAVDLSVRGSGTGGAEATYTAEEIALFKKMGLSDEEIKAGKAGSKEVK